MAGTSIILRRALLAVAAVALAAPAVALAAPAAAAGAKQEVSKGDQFSVAFNVVRKNGEKRVERFRFRNVVMTCESGPTPQFSTASIKPHFGPFRVNRNHRFGRVTRSDTRSFDGTVAIRGELQGGGQVAGTLAIDGDYREAGYLGCSSGELAWTESLR